jgi:CRISPR-associated protein Csh1
LEGKVFRKLARQNNSLVFHFLFWEKNQAQERLHLMIEDVPPSQLKRLEDLWVECHRAFLWNSYEDPVFDPKNVTLDQGIRMTFHVLASLAGKSKQDKLVMREWTLGILGRLLGGERVDVRGVKQLMISRFTGLFANSEWLRFGGVELRKMAAVIDFLTRSNRR